MTTSAVLAWWRLILVVVCLAVAVTAPLVLNQNRQSVENVNAATQQMLRLETLRSDLLGAEAAASQALLVTGEGQTVGSSYLELTDAASAQLIAAAAAQPDDSQALQDINTALAHYLSQLSVATTTAQRQQMQQASESLVNDLLPLVDSQIAIQNRALESAGDDQQWLIAVMAVPVVLLLASSVVVARRTRRVLNLGLVIALAGAAASGVLVTQLVTTTAGSISTVQSSGIARASAVAQARGAVAEAKAIEGRMLLGIVDTASGNQSYSQATGRAAEALNKLGDVDASDQLSQMMSAHDQLVAAADPPSSELLAAVQKPYDRLVSWLADQSSTIGDEVNAGLSDHANAVETRAIVVAGMMIVAAISVAAGLSRSLRRYR